jgi:hypothetical protein
MSILPDEDREDDKETLTKEEIHERNKKQQQDADAHQNQNPNLGRGHNPDHHGIGNK